MMKVFRHTPIKQIADYVKNSGVIVYPTDTVWGIGGNALDEKVATKVRTIKGKPADAKLVWLLPSLRAVEKFCGKITAAEKKILLKKRTTVIVNGQAVRVIRSGWLNQLLATCGVPLIATSANLHGQNVVRSWRQAGQVFANQDLVVVRGRKLKQVASSLVQLDQTQKTPQIKVLRAGSGISMK